MFLEAMIDELGENRKDVEFEGGGLCAYSRLKGKCYMLCRICFQRSDFSGIGKASSLEAKIVRIFISIMRWISSICGFAA